MAVTPNYALELPQPGDSMADVANGFNNAWGIIVNMPKPKAVVAGSVLPQSTYLVGDVIHLAGWKSNFLLMAIDANWGYLWRPLEAKYGPWIAPGLPVLVDPITHIISVNANFAYRFSNDGKIFFTGGLRNASGAWASGSISGFFNPLPVVCRPLNNQNVELTMAKHDMTAFKGNTSAFLYMGRDGTNLLRVYNNATGVGGAGDADEVFFNEVNWHMGTATGLWLD